MDLNLPASPATPPSAHSAGGRGSRSKRSRSPSTDPDRSVAVIGGGAVGATAAADLARWDIDVTLFERDAPAAGATGRAAGIAYDAFAEDRDAAVADRALARFRSLSGTGSFALTERPYLWFARAGDDRNAEAIREQVPRMRANDRDVAILDSRAVAERWPAFRTDDVAVAALARSAGTTAPETYAETVIEQARERGAEVRTGTRATLRTDPPRVETEDGTSAFDAVLVAAGAHTTPLLAAAGIDIACEPYRVQALTVDVATDARPDGLPSFYDATEGYYARPRGDGLLAGDGTEPVAADPDDWDPEGDEWFCEEVLGALGDRIEGVADAPREAWAGLCTATPDRDPLVGAVEPGVYVATGFHGHGFMRAPAIGELVARELCGGRGVPAFDPTRFAGTEQFEIVEWMALDE
jgi:sarcosine oxidase subunit beta